ncbi:MAG: hypothetical protein HY751_04130 [Nitrospinae bacterium]|nr:hypothetical protein [Nitrospinota bacterium]
MVTSTDSMKKKEKTCSHCGGILRYYLGSWSCMMCGRDSNHACSSCSQSKSDYKKSA